MKNYIASTELDTTKTYYKYVDVLVRFEDGSTQYIEKVTATTKADILNIIFMVIGGNKMLSYEIKDTFFRLKDKWVC
tara:strand:- start:235 stop:465 length:231 start_codon:yes stop_codon:yes gene_type:complete